MIIVDASGNAAPQLPPEEPHSPNCMMCRRMDPAASAQHQRIIAEEQGRAQLMLETERGTPWNAYSVEQLCQIIREAP